MVMVIAEAKLPRINESVNVYVAKSGSFIVKKRETSRLIFVFRSTFNYIFGYRYLASTFLKFQSRLTTL